MGLIDFVKSAGQKLGLVEKDKAPSAPAPAPSGPAAGPSAEEIKRTHERRKGMALVKAVQALGLEVEDLSIRVDDDVVTVGGKAPSQEVREKVVLAVGNTAGIARVDDRMEVSSSEPVATLYTVQSGDTLSKIAKTHYGNAMKYPVIFEANRPMLTDPDKIYPGQVLRIPPLGD